MGGLIFADRRLVDIAHPPIGGPLTALVLARTQAAASERLGHILAYNDEYVWRRIRSSVIGRRVNRLNVRCIACSCVAHLDDWIGFLRYSDVELELLLNTRFKHIHEDHTRFLRPCPGPRYLDSMLELLEGMTAIGGIDPLGNYAMFGDPQSLGARVGQD